MAEAGSSFPTCRHNKARATKIFLGGLWRLLLVCWVVEQSWSKNRTRKRSQNLYKREGMKWVDGR